VFVDLFFIFRSCSRMRIDRSHLFWILLVTAFTVIAGISYSLNLHPEFLPRGVKFPAFLGPVPPTRANYGGTPLGLLFGIVAFGIFLFAAALGVRKKKRLWPIGSVQTWLKAHLWLTVFTVPLVVLHSGFRIGGPHTMGLLALYTLVMGSGIFGVILQHFLPTIMREHLPREVVFEQIPFVRESLLQAATELRTQVAEANALGLSGDTSPQILGRFLDDECLPFLSVKKGVRNLDLGNAKLAAEMFKLLRVNVHSEWRPRVDEIESWCESRRLTDLQTKFQHWLHGWLLVHVPTSLVLIIVTTWHAWAGIRFLVTQTL